LQTKKREVIFGIACDSAFVNIRGFTYGGVQFIFVVALRFAIKEFYSTLHITLQLAAQKNRQYNSKTCN
jgi:phage-related holin